MCGIMLGENYCQALKAICLFNNKMMRQIEQVSEDNEEHKLTSIKCSPNFLLYKYESADVTGLSLLFVVVKYCFEENIREDFMFCLPLTED
jgi:hypothetical protein